MPGSPQVNVTDVPATAPSTSVTTGMPRAPCDDGDDAGADQRDDERGRDRDAPDEASRGGRRACAGAARCRRRRRASRAPRTVPDERWPIGACAGVRPGRGDGVLAADAGALVEVDGGRERPASIATSSGGLREPELLLDRLQVADELERAGLAVLRTLGHGAGEHPLEAARHVDPAGRRDRLAFSMRAMSAGALSPPGISNGVRPASSE